MRQRHPDCCSLPRCALPRFASLRLLDCSPVDFLQIKKVIASHCLNSLREWTNNVDRLNCKF